jgi:hypothetical protein
MPFPRLHLTQASLHKTTINKVFHRPIWEVLSVPWEAALALLVFQKGGKSPSLRIDACGLLFLYSKVEVLPKKYIMGHTGSINVSTIQK